MKKLPGRAAALCAATILILAAPSHARTEESLYKPRVETKLKWGTQDRSLMQGQLWIPLRGLNNQVLYSDLRFMKDNQDGLEGNAGLGYRYLLPNDKGILGLYGFFDRKRSITGNFFNQLTGGVEAMGNKFDIRLNGYFPLSSAVHKSTSGGFSLPYLAGTGIFINRVNMQNFVEEPLTGFDLELGYRVPIFEENIDSVRVYGGVYGFYGDEVEDIRGWRARVTADTTNWLQLGARYQHDTVRGAQGFLEATFRFPSKKSWKQDGLRSRMDETPERDVDIVSNSKATIQAPVTETVLNANTSTAQKIYYVDNTKIGGDGSLENPFATLAQAEAAAQENDIIYVNRGDGTSTGLNNGIALKANQLLIGSSQDLTYDMTKFTAASGASFAGLVLKSGTGANPQISNPAGAGITISTASNDVRVLGVNVDTTLNDGVLIQGANASLTNMNITNAGDNGVDIGASGAGATVSATLRGLTITNSTHNGVAVTITNNASAQITMQSTRTSANGWHGISLYDDSTAGSIDADLGGGGRSTGGNSFTGNSFEDVAVELDGGTVSAQNNWWGQPGGPTLTQVYQGAPLFYDNLQAHWSFDQGRVVGTTLFDRSGNGNNGNMLGGVNAGSLTGGQNGSAISFDGVDDSITVPINVPESGYTYLSWFRTVDAGGAFSAVIDPFAAGYGAGSHDRQYGINGGGRLCHRVWADETYCSAANVNDNAWHFSAVTVGAAAGGGRLYLDDTQVATGVKNTSDFNWQTGIVLGGHSAWGYYAGLVDDFRVYDRVLTPAEMSEIYRMNGTSVADTANALGAAP